MGTGDKNQLKRSNSLWPGNHGVHVLVLVPAQGCCQKPEVCSEGPSHTVFSQHWALTNERLQHSPLCAPTSAITQHSWTPAHTAGHLHTYPGSRNSSCSMPDAEEMFHPHIHPQPEPLSCFQFILPSFISKPSALMDLMF